MKTTVALLSALLLSACMTTAQMEAQRAQQEEENARIRQWVADQVASTCAYAEGNPVAWGECNRQTRQFLFQMWMARQAAIGAAQPVTTECRPTFLGRVSCVTQ